MKLVQRSFIPGDHWIYFKIYTGIKVADRILTKNISIIIHKLNKKQIIDKWFFIRYNDPDFHIRIRILVKNKSDIGEVISLFYLQFRNLIKSNEIWKIQLDTYNRELERYGKTLIEISESIFHIDSECILSTLIILEKYKNENFRWMIGIKMIDIFLSDFSLNLKMKQELLKVMNKSFKKEFGFNKFNSKEFNSKFRENKKTIESVLNQTINDPNFADFTTIIKKKSKKIRLIISLINKTQSSPTITDISALLSTYIHMLINRLFRSKSRLYEVIIYDFLYRYYTSEIVKNKSEVTK